MSFMRWRSDHTDGFAVFKTPEGFENYHLLLAGEKIGKEFPKDVATRMSPDYPRDLELSDNLFGTTVVVISNRLKKFLDSDGAASIEYFKLKLLDHKGRTVAEDYSIMHPYDPVECIDLEKTGPRWNPLNPSAMFSCDGLVLRPNSVPADRKIFRMKSWPQHILIRKETADALQKAGMTGLLFKPAEGFRGMG